MAYHGPQGCPLQDGHVDFMFLDLLQPKFLRSVFTLLWQNSMNTFCCAHSYLQNFLGSTQSVGNIPTNISFSPIRIGSTDTTLKMAIEKKVSVLCEVPAM